MSSQSNGGPKQDGSDGKILALATAAHIVFPPLGLAVLGAKGWADKCPSCGKWWAKKQIGQRILKSQVSSEPVFGELFSVTTAEYVDDFQCGFCSSTWTQGAPRVSKTFEWKCPNCDCVDNYDCTSIDQTSDPSCTNCGTRILSVIDSGWEYEQQEQQILAAIEQKEKTLRMAHLAVTTTMSTGNQFQASQLMARYHDVKSEVRELRQMLKENSWSKDQARQAAEHRKRRQAAQLQEREDFLNSLPRKAAKLLTKAQSDQDEVAAIRRLAEVFKGIGINEWIWLHTRTPFMAEQTYEQLRSLLIPKLNVMWANRSNHKDSLISALKVIAQSLLYTDLTGVITAGRDLPRSISEMQSRYQTLSDDRNRLQMEITAKQTEKLKESSSLKELEEQFNKAKEEQEATVDEQLITQQTRDQLRGSDLGIGCGLVMLAIAAITLLTMFSPNIGKDTKDNPIGVVAILGGLGYYFAIRPLRNRRLSPEQFEERLRGKTRENVTSIFKEREDSLNKATEKLESLKTKLQSIDQEIEAATKRLNECESAMKGLMSRLDTITDEMLGGRIDPLMRAITA